MSEGKGSPSKAELLANAILAQMALLIRLQQSSQPYDEYVKEFARISAALTFHLNRHLTFEDNPRKEAKLKDEQ